MRDVIKVSSNVVGPVEECVDIVYRFCYRSSKKHRDIKQTGDTIGEDVVCFSAGHSLDGEQTTSLLCTQNMAAVSAHMDDAATGKGEETT